MQIRRLFVPVPAADLPRPVRAAACATLATLLLAGSLGAQSVEDRIRELGAENGRLYSHPVATGLGAALNAGWHHSAKALGPFHVEIGVRAMGALTPDRADFFQPVLPQEITSEDLGGRTFQDPYGDGEGLVTPTAVGEGRGITVQPQGEFRDALLAAGLNPADFALRFPDGFDIPTVPMGMLQVKLGLLQGVEATGRFIPSIEVSDDIGSIESLGGGLKLTVTDWVAGRFPLDVAVAGGIQSFDAGDYLSIDARHASLLVSRDFSVLTLYASGRLEESEVDVEYTVENPNLPESGTTVTFEDEGDNTSSFTAGFNLDLLFLQLDAGYTVSDYNLFTAGLGLQF